MQCWKLRRLRAGRRAHAGAPLPDFSARNRVTKVQVGVLKPAFIQKMFRDSSSTVVLERMLLIISQVARMAKVSGRGGAPGAAMADNYKLLHQSQFYGPVGKLFLHKDAQVRMRVCNLVGALRLPALLLHRAANGRMHLQMAACICNAWSALLACTGRRTCASTSAISSGCSACLRCSCTGRRVCTSAPLFCFPSPRWQSW